MACGEIGLDVNNFYELTPRQLQNISEGYINKEQRKSRHLLELTRYICFYSSAPMTKKINKLEDIMVFDWDNEKPNQEVDLRTPEEQLKDVKDFWDKIDNRKN